jgi:hypothetical protein
LKHFAENKKGRLSALPNVGPYIYDVKISGFTKSSIYIYIYIYNISRLRVKVLATNASTKGASIFFTAAMIRPFFKDFFRFPVAVNNSIK